MYRNSQFILSHLLSISYTNLSFYKTQNNCGCLQYFRLQPQTCCDRDVMTGCEKFACSCQFLECFESGWYISSYISCRTSDTSKINQLLINQTAILLIIKFYQVLLLEWKCFYMLAFFLQWQRLVWRIQFQVCRSKSNHF